MNNQRLIAYCGLYCGLCAQRCRIPQRARALQQAMRLEAYEYWAKELPDFGSFWNFLKRLEESESQCNCRSGQCGPPACEIRECARGKNVEVCVFCDEYPCDHIKALAERYPTLLADGERLKRIGKETWIAEQEERRRSGFCYGDIRCPSGAANEKWGKFRKGKRGSA